MERKDGESPPHFTWENFLTIQKVPHNFSPYAIIKDIIWDCHDLKNEVSQWQIVDRSRRKHRSGWRIKGTPPNPPQ